jgi:hypothetical protein
LQVRGYACDCSYPEYCDSQLGKLPPPRTAAQVAQDQQQQHQEPHQEPHQEQQAQQQQAQQQEQRVQQQHAEMQQLHEQEDPAHEQQQQHQGMLNGCSKADLPKSVDGHHQSAVTAAGSAKSYMADAPVEAAAASRAAAQALEDAHVHQVGHLTVAPVTTV